MGQKMIRNKKVKEADALERRVANIQTPELILWANQALFGIGRNITDWERMHDFPLLDEALVGAEALTAVVKELRNRNSGSRNF